MWTTIRRLTLVSIAATALLAASAVSAHASIPAHVWDTGADRLIVRADPSSSGAEVTRLTENTEVTVECQVEGEAVDGTTLWNYLPEYDGFASDRYIYTGHDGAHPDLPACDDSNGAMAEGFDNSNNNEGTIDFDTAAEQFDFAILKASESTDFTDAYFVERFQAAKGNLIIGAYHFFDPRADGVAQAEHNLAVLEEAGYDVADTDTLPIMVDVEPNYVEPEPGFCFDVDAATMNQRLTDYVAHITEVTGQAPMVYTNGEMVNDCGLDTSPLTDQPLVVPAWEQWDADPLATAQALGWDDWTFWQYKSYITVPGGVGALADRFNGDTAALVELAAA